MRVSRKGLTYIFLSTVIAASLMAAPAEAKKADTGFLDRTVNVAGIKYKYQVFVPEDWTKKKKWPVILFLHGAGERGNDGLIQTEVGIGTAIRRYRDRFPAIIVMPQCHKNVWWSESAMADMVMAALAQAQKEFHGDPARTYLTGLSMGGYGTWNLAGEFPGKFAAVVPICGGILVPDMARQQPADDNSPYTEAAKKIGRMPVWIFHGGDDPVVPVTESRRMAEAMRTVVGQDAPHTQPQAIAENLAEVIYTEYPGVGHNSWEKAYAEHDLMSWLLTKSLLNKAYTLH